MKVKLLMLLFFSISLSCQIYSENLTVWHTETDPSTLAALDTIARKFEIENPNVKVNIVAVGWQDLYRRLALALESGVVPDITQIEPFMAAYLVEKRFLSPLDDVIANIEESEIFESVKKLQFYNKHYYGIATALGISYYAYRFDLAEEFQKQPPTTWNELLQFVKNNKGKEISPILLPSNDLHVTLLFCELLSSNNGSLFDENGKPDFNNEKVIETLDFWKELYTCVPNNFQHNSYSENFSTFARGQSRLMPNFFGRGLLSIERIGNEKETNPNYYKLFPHIIGPSGKIAYATLDAEAWTIPEKSVNKVLAKKFLDFFYRKDIYLIFCRSVPIHLTPIFKNLAYNEYMKEPFIQKWKSFYDYELKMLEDNQVMPIFMSKFDHKNIPALFRLEGTGVIANMVRNVTENKKSSKEAAITAEKTAIELMPMENSKTPSSVTPLELLLYFSIFATILIVVLILVKRFRR